MKTILIISNYKVLSHRNILILCSIYLISVNLIHQSLQLNECQFADNYTNPCKHGICIISNSEPGYQCYCFNGFTGINCTKKYDQCFHHNLCQNNAICHNLEDIPDVKCLCSPGYCGKYCEFEVNECLSDPCFNGGRCVDKVNAYECDCPRGYFGKRCEIDLNVCQNENSTLSPTTLCFNGGTCVDGPGDRYFCACDRGFTGMRCQTRVSECDSYPCFNNGRCYEREHTYYCTCSLGWAGKTCETSLVECEESLCKNNGICQRINGTQKSDKLNDNSEKDQIFCYCLPDFYGDYCQYKFDECSPNPCLNKGNCTHGIDSYICNCSEGLGGKHCQLDCSDPMNYELCIFPTTATIDTNTSYLPTISTPIVSSVESDFQSYKTSIFNSIYSSFNEPNYTSIKLTTTQILSTSHITDSLTTYTISSIPSITISPSIPFEPEPSSTLELNITIPPSHLKEPKIFIPSFNGFNSSLIYRSKRSKEDFVSISLEFKTDTNSTDHIVPVLYSKSKHNYELILYIENNLIKLLVSKQMKRILLIETKFKITAKSLNKIDAKLWIASDSRLYSILTINETQKHNVSEEMSGTDSREICGFDVFFLGEMPAKYNMSFDRNLTNFKGCIRNIHINKYEMFVTDAIKAKDISECEPNVDICAQSPCRNGGLCRREGQSWQCMCPDGYASDLCEKAHCNGHVCHNDGICILPDYRTYLCVCPHGWSGKRCESRMSQTMASFNLEANNNSFIKYNLKNQTNHLEIKFRFATQNLNQSKALILFMYNQHNNRHNQNFIIDFMSISLESEILFFRINLGHGTKSLWVPLNPKLREQLVFFGHHKKFVWLIVVPEDIQQTKPIVGETPQSFEALNVSSHLYVGGHESYRGHPYLQSLTGFTGCIYDIEIRTKLNTDFQMLSNDLINKSENVGICHIMDECGRK